MRASIGLGLIAIAGLVACAADSNSDSAANSIQQDTPAPGSTGSSTDPTEPAAPPSQPSEPQNVEPPPAPIARGIAVTDVALFQGVKVPVVKDGEQVPATKRKAPVVAKRPGLLRVYVTPESSWSTRALTAELRLVASDGAKFPVLRETKTISASSTDEDINSTFNFEIPGDNLPAGVTFQVALSTPDGDAPDKVGKADARYPRDGSYEDIGAKLSGKLRVVAVPVKYDADGSGRTPPLGDAQLDAYRSQLMRVYPSSEIEITAHAPFPFSQQISTNGGGFQNILQAITQLRQDDKVDDDVYYYGLLAPKASFSAYCGGSCVTGLSSIVDDPDTAGMRASVGIGFGDTVSAQTMAHEVGHAHGRYHAPCGGAAGSDPKFPYQGGGIGTWGYDMFAKTLIPPTKGKDMMGYCPNTWWISDYSYTALYERISAISLEKSVASFYSTTPQAEKKAASFRVATVDGNGGLTWNGDLKFNDENQIKGGATRQATFLAESGAQMFSKAKFFPFDHLPGGFLFIPKDTTIDATHWKTVSVEGFANALAR
jgi:Peptidase M66